MATLREMITALDTFVESSSGLNINCIKGYPDFRRDNISTPLSALFYGGSSVGDNTTVSRIGASKTSVVVTLGVYASNEVELFELAALLQALRKTPVSLTAGTDSQLVRVYFGDDEREPPDDEAPKELRHVLTCGLVMNYEG